jgi:hypothetical protein
MWLSPHSSLQLLVLGGLLGGGVMTLVAAIFSVYFCLSIQVLAFEPVTANPISMLKRSYHLVDGQFARTLALILIIGILTNTLIPSLVAMVMDVTRVTGLLAVLGFEGLVREILGNVRFGHLFGEDSIFQVLDTYLNTHIPSITQSLIQLTIVSLVTVLLLPLGTFAFTLLYGDLQARKRLEHQPLSTAEPLQLS